MKKFLAILLAMMLVMVSVAALAGSDGTGDTQQPAQSDDAGDNGDGGNGDDSGTGSTTGGNTTGGTAVNIITKQKLSTTPSSFTLTKTYTKTGSTAVNPADNLQFTVSKAARSESSDNFTSEENEQNKYPVTIAAVDKGEGIDSATITVALPTYDLTGIYSYTINEVDTNKAGVTYLSDTLYLNVTVVTNQTTSALEIAGIAVHKASADGTKIDEFENKYEAGSLKISKTVTGNLGDRTKDFEFTVTFTAPTTGTAQDVVNAAITVTTPTGQAALTTPATDVATNEWTNGVASKTFTLKHGQEVTFNNIPKNVTYTVVEKDAAASGPNAEGYTTTKIGDSGTIGTTEAAAAFTNDKQQQVDTGITLETLPYVLMMALAMMGLVALKLRKREEY